LGLPVPSNDLIRSWKAIQLPASAKAGSLHFWAGEFIGINNLPTPLLEKSCAHLQNEIVEGTPFHDWVTPDGRIWSVFYRMGNAYLIRFPALADFTIEKGGERVVVNPVPDIPVQTVEHLYFNQVLPLALSRQFILVLHAGAIEISDFSVAFIGDSGRGKSTLAASFAASGYRFLTDDGLQLEKEGCAYLAKPSHPSIRLWDDSRDAIVPHATNSAPPVDYTPKTRLLADDVVPYCNVPRPLKAMYFLGEGNTNTVSIEPVSGRDTMIELVRHSFLLDIEEREMLSHHFGQLSDLAKRPIFFRLDYPRQYDMLPKVREAVVKHASALPMP
jgi:hypothetical protein